MITYNRRCGLCGQYVADSDHEALLDLDRWQWSEALVEEALVDAHQCTDTDPYGARAYDRLAAAGLVTAEPPGSKPVRATIELAIFIGLALEQHHEQTVPGWVVFAAVVVTRATATTTALTARPTTSTTTRSVRAYRHGDAGALVHTLTARGARAP